MVTNYLKNWTIEKIGGSCVVIGKIYNDIKKRFVDGTKIHTSKILKADFISGLVETLNSVYHLEID